MDRGNAQTALWKTETPRGKKPIYSNEADPSVYAKINYLVMLDNGKAFVPVSEGDYLHLIGKILNPHEFSAEDSSERLIYIPLKTQAELRYSKKQKELKQRIAELEDQVKKLSKGKNHEYG